MMQESKLNNLQRKRIEQSLKSESTHLGFFLIIQQTSKKKKVQLPHNFSLSPTDGSASPVTFDSTSSASPHQPERNRKRLSDKPQRRTAESCRSGNSYVREKFCPGPTSMIIQLLARPCNITPEESLTPFVFILRFTQGDLEKEKQRLQDIMSTGHEEPAAVTPRNVPACRSREVEEERDRFQEGEAGEKNTQHLSSEESSPRCSVITLTRLSMLQFWMR